MEYQLSSWVLEHKLGPHLSCPETAAGAQENTVRTHRVTKTLTENSKANTEESGNRKLLPRASL